MTPRTWCRRDWCAPSRRQRALTDVHSAEAYVRQAVRTSFLDHARRRATWRRAAHLLADDGGRRSPEDTATDGVDVRAALAALPPRQLACVVLRHVDDLPVAMGATDTGGSTDPGYHSSAVAAGPHVALSPQGSDADWVVLPHALSTGTSGRTAVPPDLYRVEAAAGTRFVITRSSRLHGAVSLELLDPVTGRTTPVIPLPEDHGEAAVAWYEGVVAP